MAAIAVAAEAQIPDEAIKAALATFGGVKRRFQLTGEWQGVRIYDDDYGHHPIEIAAVLRATKAGTKGKVVAVVEPHRYSRLKDLFPDFCRCFTSADQVVVIPLYSAGEAPLDGISSASLAEGIRAHLARRSQPLTTSKNSPSTSRPAHRAATWSFASAPGVSTEWALALPELMGGTTAAGART